MTNNHTSRYVRTALGLGLVALAVLASSAAEAKITRIEITVVESPTFEGTAFGEVGQYEKLTGMVYGEVDPADPLNAIITDIELAPTNADGMVEYSAEVFILRPVDPAHGNHRVLYDLNNRGDMRAMRLNEGGGGNNPATAEDAGNGFLMRQGYTILSSGWDALARPPDRINITVPIARNPDGTSIVGPSMEEWVVDDNETTRGELTYAPATLDPSKAQLYVRAEAMGERTEIPSSGWRYNDDGMSVSLLPEGTPFESGKLYDFVYEAKDPLVAGLGFAAIRDVADFFRNAQKDTAGNANPLAGNVEYILSYCISQPCRLVNDYLNLGFNETEGHERAIDGMLQWVGGADGVFMNYRFAQTFRTHRQRQARWFPEFQFPFADVVTTDPVSGQKEGRLRRCMESNTCPQMLTTNSDNEYWAKNMALLHISADGAEDLPDPGSVRYYHMASLPHGARSGGRGICAHERNPLAPYAVHRALLLALDAWVTEGTEPPKSRLPRLADGTLVPSMPQDGAGFPQIPGIDYNGRQHTGDLFDYGPHFGDGILTVLPPILVGTPYPTFVPKTDEDGNTIAGVRLPEVQVPLATYTGWNRRAGVPQEDCGGSGIMVSFPKTKEDRLASGDPRLSIAERYPTHQEYVDAVAKAAEGLMREGLLLQEDVDRYTERATATPISD